MTPRLVARVGLPQRAGARTDAAGAPTLVLTNWSGTAVIIAVSIVRGAGFAICVVAGGAVTATLIPADRRGEGLALVGVVGGVPGMLALPAGVWAADVWGFARSSRSLRSPRCWLWSRCPGCRRAPPRFRPGVPTGAGRTAQPCADPPGHDLRRFHRCSRRAGDVPPLASRDQPTWVAAAALLVQPAAATAARWFAGRIGDRCGAVGLLAPAMLLCAVGMALLAVTSSPAAIISGALIFGIGFGAFRTRPCR